MRTIIFSFFIVLSTMLSAQAPALIPYQAIARNGLGQALNNATINARFTIHDGSAMGTAVWQEMQTVTTSALGLFTAQLGSSVALGDVNWANGAKFMQVEIDLGQGFLDLGTQQMLSVPYALHAQTADTASIAEISSNGFSGVSSTGDTLYLANGNFLIVPGISQANNVGVSENTAHTCGIPNIHNSLLNYGSMTDQQGNVYKTIVIGTQEWMAENLNTSIYRNGDEISTDLDSASWVVTTEGAWVYYDDNSSFACPYGRLYNWYACADARQLCPQGWHVPSDVEWMVLTEFLGSYGVAGGKMKTLGTVEDQTGMWHAPNQGASNSSGFSGVPGGGRTSLGWYGSMGTFGIWWSTTEFNSNVAISSLLDYYDDDGTVSYDIKQSGFSVRCLRD